MEYKAVINEEEIKSWLMIIFQKKNFKSISIDVEGTSKKGDGFLGDIIFVHLSAMTQDESKQEYDLVLKCSKRSQKLRENSPVQEAFLNEMYVYENIFPVFTQFQLEKGIEDPFNAVPKCYGTYKNDSMEVIALENLKKRGYTLWNKKYPMTRKHIDMVIKEYGKFHALSVAMWDQQPEKFKELSNGKLHDVWKAFVDNGDMDSLFGRPIEEAHDVLINDFDEDTLSKWKNFRNQVDYVFKEMLRNVTGLKVLIHGDCWNNNFIFHCKEDQIPEKVAILDWQITQLSSPIFDLSYFLFACISGDDILDMDTILKEYYESFSEYLRRLGSKPEILYSFKQFLSEWKQYSKFGIFMSATAARMNGLDPSELPDITENAENSKEFSEAFIVDVKDTSYLRNRIKHIVKYVTQTNLVS